jgi:hypothetical protein
MLFKYTINLEIEVEFDAPLLGADSTVFRRSQTDKIAKQALTELLRVKTPMTILNKEIDLDNLKGTIKSRKTLGSVKR